jgi:RHS repeat-associated protein
VTTGQVAYHHYDARGHAILLTNSSGGIMEQYEYDAFGQPYFFNSTGGALTVNGQPGSPHGNRFLFTGREYLSELKLYDYRNRMYQPELGRFLQPDPKHFAAGDYNLYRYCHNDPVNRADPLGLHGEKVVREFTKNIQVTGSHIPIHIRYTESGNWNDTEIANHYDPNLLSRTGYDGSTMGIGSVNQAGSTVHIDLNVNWFVDSKWRDTNVVTRELEHVRDFREFSQKFANSLSPNRPLPSLTGFPSRVRDFGADQQRKYDPDPIRGVMDKPHNTHLYPPLPVKLPTHENTANELGR